MKFEYINRKYTEKVAELMEKGYYLNAGTMAGHQGEISKIDLTNGKEIVRVLLEHETVYEDNYDSDVVRLIVGRSTETRVRPNEATTYSTIWNNNLEILSEELFYEIGRRRGHPEDKWYGTKEEAMESRKKRYARRRSETERKEFPEAAYAKVLPFLRRQKGCKSLRLHEIEGVTKCVSRSRTGKVVVSYTVKAKGKVYGMC